MATTRAATRIPMIPNTLTQRGVLGLESKSPEWSMAAKLLGAERKGNALSSELLGTH